MITVSDTSPISNLAIIGRLDLMRVVYGSILIPRAVRRELEALRHSGALGLLRDAEASGWLTTVDVSDTNVVLVLSEELDQGEAEALALAMEIGARVVLDELEGRLVARRLGLAVRGTLWVLSQGKKMGLVHCLRDEIARLRTEAHFWISAKLEGEMLQKVGESGSSLD